MLKYSTASFRMTHASKWGVEDTQIYLGRKIKLRASGQQNGQSERKREKGKELIRFLWLRLPRFDRIESACPLFDGFLFD
jgi:hypothetical protein